jgi:hypothetical protein
MSLHRVPFEELRLACRQKLETCELWLRRLIHEELMRCYGETYFNQGIQNENHIFKKEIRDHSAKMLNENPKRYSREVDTLLIEHIVITICKHDLYHACFSLALQDAYPDGREEARTFLSRLIPIRNALSHANPITVHDAERVLCYCDDIIESLKRHYSERNMAQEYNAPLFTRFTDSLGHSEVLSRSTVDLNFRTTPLRVGDNIRWEVEVDSSFQPDDYQVEWSFFGVRRAPSEVTPTGLSFALTLLPKHVGETLFLMVCLTSKRDWHRWGPFDAMLEAKYKVLPALE